MIQLSPLDLKDFSGAPAERRAISFILTTQTCGEACWHAREDVCRCSCGGRNHGCLNHGGAKPERTAKIDGQQYRLLAVGLHRDLMAQASEINRRQWRSVEKPTVLIDSTGANWTPAEIEAARQAGKRISFMQYRYTWSETDSGAPARIKSASASQRNWEELSGWKAERSVYLLWERVTMPEAPAELVIDRETGKPLENQKPTR